MRHKNNGIMRGIVLQLGDKSICLHHESNGIMRKKQDKEKVIAIQNNQKEASILSF